MASQGDIRAYELEMEQQSYSGEPYAGTLDDLSLLPAQLGYGVVPFNPEPVNQASTGMSYFDSFLGFITPESHAESIVNQIYSTPGNTLKRDPVYNREDFSSPNVYVATKGAISSAAGAVSSAVSGTVTALSGFAKWGLVGVVLILLAVVAVYAGVGAFVRR